MVNASDAAREIAETYGTNNPFELCERMGIICASTALPSSVNGFFRQLGDKCVIMLNDALGYGEKKYVCAHELGHAVMHKGFNSLFMSKATCLNVDRLEREADIFAVNLIIESAEYLYNTFGLSTRSQISNFYGLDERLVDLRFNKP